MERELIKLYECVLNIVLIRKFQIWFIYVQALFTIDSKVSNKNPHFHVRLHISSHFSMVVNNTLNRQTLGPTCQDMAITIISVITGV